MSTARRDLLQQIEQEVQKQWEEQKIFEVDAPMEPCDKFFVTFPYPYMNGLLHVGHAFSLTKAIFAANFNRLLGKKVLFPFGYHCTGMPIQAAANKLTREYATYGSPIPTFPAGRPQPKTTDEGVPILDDDGNVILSWKVPPSTGSKAVQAYKLMARSGGEADFKMVLDIKAAELPIEKGKVKASAPVLENGCVYKVITELEDGSTCPESALSDEILVDAAPVKKGSAAVAGKKVAKKILMKTGDASFQWEILKSMGIAPEDIVAFTSPEHWLRHFPPLGTESLKRFGCPTDFRRSFITTSVNPYYDKFIRWQFNVLKVGDRIGFGKRPTMYSEVDGQACMDHDRAEGEGVGPQEYTAIKIQLLEYPDKMKKFEGQKVYLLAATLRAETMPGQTNCWILPKGTYGCYKAGDDVYVCSHRAARNMSFQDILMPRGKPELLLEITGADLMGCTVKAPQSPYSAVHLLPLMTIKMDKGTGIVTSVPSDSPDDYAAFMDLMKPAKRDHFGVKAEWVEPFKLIPILKVEIDGEVREMAAPYMCEKLGVQSQNDKEKLQEAHDTCYKLGFDKGIMSVGPMAGLPVKEAKFKFRSLMIDAGEAFIYHEPEKKVVSRSGDECVIAGIDQWYLKYGETNWRETIEKHINSENFNPYNDGIRDAFMLATSWLKEWACSRSFGLGTRVPWDEQFLIESLSDSTIYMAYYTIAHFLQGGVLDGSMPGADGVKPDDLTDEVFNFIFKNGPMPERTNIQKPVLEKMKKEFLFWYPLDLRVSARDLIPNHLTMSLYNHAAVWDKQPEMWPRSIYCNGMLLMNNEKMSKSKGNFLTLDEMIAKFTADSVRLGCANAGDTLEDGNFEEAVANKAILQQAVFMDTLAGFVNQTEPTDEKSAADFRFVDRWFANEMNRLVAESRAQYERMFFREALGACYFKFMNCFDQYRDVCKAGLGLPNRSLVMRYFEWQFIILSPICPHFCERGWQVLGKQGSVMNARWPEATAPIDDSITLQGTFIFDKVPHEFIKLKEKASKHGEPGGATVYVAQDFPEWKVLVLESLRAKHKAGQLPVMFTEDMGKDEAAKAQWKDIVTELMANPKLKPFAKHVGPFAAFKREEAASSGVSALEAKSPFDEMSLVKENVSYLKSKLNMEVVVRAASEPLPGHEDRVKEGQPGKPVIVYEPPVAGAKASAPAPTKSGAPKAKAVAAVISDIKELEKMLSNRSYIEGGHAVTEADFAQLPTALAALAKADADAYPHVNRWCKHINFLAKRQQR